MSNWFQDWFETPEYLSVYRRRDDYDAGRLLALFLESARLAPGASILDLACGAGRHSLQLAAMGFNVTGVDLSNNLLRIAREHAAAEMLTAEFIQEDIRSLNLSTKFSAVINVFTSFGYFESDEENFHLFTTAYRHLLKGGFFLFDYFNSYWLSRSLVPLSYEEIEGYSFHFKREVLNSRVLKHIEIVNGSTVKKYMESVALYTPEQITASLEQNGFRVLRLYGDYLGAPFESLTSARLVVLCQK